MLFFTAAAAAVSLTRHHEQQKETQRGGTELEIMEFSIFDCYLGATVSNYCLEPLKKLITGSDRRTAGQQDGQMDGRTAGPASRYHSDVSSGRYAGQLSECDMFLLTAVAKTHTHTHTRTYENI